jgi:hypothetical protein
MLRTKQMHTSPSQPVQAYMRYAQDSSIRTMADRSDDRENPSIQSSAGYSEKGNETGTKMVRH